jgi:hypothetical protein
VPSLSEADPTPIPSLRNGGLVIGSRSRASPRMLGAWASRPDALQSDVERCAGFDISLARGIARFAPCAGEEGGQ